VKKCTIMAEMTENNGRSWARVLVGGMDIGLGTYVFGRLCRTLFVWRNLVL
jgi:hypothetical protein